MERRRLGASELEVTVVGLGCNNFGKPLDVEASRPVIDRALELGINFLDTADRYGGMGGSETVLGEVLGARRKDIILATKFGGQMDAEGRDKGASRAYILRAVEASLRRLKTDWIDLYQLHFDDPATPLEETLGALDELVQSGKVRFVGCSNLTPARLRQAQAAAAQLGVAGFCSVQDEYSLLARASEAETIPAAVELGMGFIPYFPLASGMLTGKFRPGQQAPAGSRIVERPALVEAYMTEAAQARLRALLAYADEIGRPLLDLALGWLCAKPFVASVITGATRPDQIAANVAAGERRLPAEVIARLDELTR